MLDRAFLETPDYRTLIETSDRIVVVGRRGTGKSALARALRGYWDQTDAVVIDLAPHEYQVISLRPQAQLFGAKFSRVRAGMRLLWRYALMTEAALRLTTRAAFRGSPEFSIIDPHVARWSDRGNSITERFRRLTREALSLDSSPEERIGDLPSSLSLSELENALVAACGRIHTQVIFLIDRLDEGYEPDDVGVGIVDGLVQAAIDIKTRIPNVRPVVFLRDNIFRSVQSLDADYSRVIEGHVIRLHWDEAALLDFTSARLKIAFDIRLESSIKIWNACTLDELHGKDGFIQCLRLTLYRPRDVLALLNEAFFFAQRSGHIQVSASNIEATAETISKNRLDDLQKEYSAILPSLGKQVAIFRDQSPERRVDEVTIAIETAMLGGSADPLIQQDLFILEDAKSVIRGLYSIGFLGIRDPSTGSIVFCHDGRAPDREFAVGDVVLVHPCYWMALNCTRAEIGPDRSEDIYDEYDIEVASETPHIRKIKISALISQLAEIPEGQEGDQDYEAWCYKALRICFAKSLRNIEFKPNRLARQRRDIVGTNLGEDGAWQRIRDDYGTRQVCFEVKNYKGLSSADYQQIQSYLGGEYGRLAIFITRDDSVDLFSGRDVEWVRDMYMKHQYLVIKLTGTYFRKLLHKLVNPSRHDDVDDAIHKILDTYTRLYLEGQTMTSALNERRMSRKKQRKLAALEATSKT